MGRVIVKNDIPSCLTRSAILLESRTVLTSHQAPLSWSTSTKSRMRLFKAPLPKGRVGSSRVSASSNPRRGGLFTRPHDAPRLTAWSRRSLILTSKEFEKVGTGSCGQPCRQTISNLLLLCDAISKLRNVRYNIETHAERRVLSRK